jgi:cytoskeletal protein RodZ
MPALFAYLIALGLLLGGGYGALSWLAAPEPVKVVAKARPTPRPHFDEASRETASEPSGQQAEQKPQKASPETIGQSDRIAVGSVPPPIAPPAEASTASTQQDAQAGAQAEVSLPTQTQAAAPAQVQQNPAGNARMSSAEIGPPPEQPQPVQAASTGSQATAASTAAAAVAKTAKPKRPHQQRLASRSEKPALALMTLRTIEFPDGRRVTQLLPYRDGDRD